MVGLVVLAMVVIESLRSPAPDEVVPNEDDVLVLRFGASPAEGAIEGLDFHVVQDGDTLSSIALQRLGDMTLAEELARLNGLTNPDRLTPGQTIRLR